MCDGGGRSRVQTNSIGRKNAAALHRLTGTDNVLLLMSYCREGTTPIALVMESFDMSNDPIVYRIDADDRIVSVNTAFHRFAEQNGSPGLAKATIGSSLWSAIAGDETSLLWRELVARARSHAVVSVPYRCDAPDLRRQLQMQLFALPAGGVEFVSTLTHAEERDPVALLAASYGIGEPVRACSWCRRVDIDGYVEIEHAVARLALLEQELRPISHTLCPNCSDEVRATAGLPAA